jgi:hypothetical protein
LGVGEGLAGEAWSSVRTAAVVHADLNAVEARAPCKDAQPTNLPPAATDGLS